MELSAAIAIIYSAFIAVIVYFIKSGDMVAFLLLVSAWLFAVYSIYKLPKLSRSPQKLYYLVISSIALGLLFFAFGNWVVTQKSPVNRDSLYAAALDEPIKYLFIVVRLKERTNFEDIIPLDLGFEINKFDETGTFQGLRIRVQDAGMISHLSTSDIVLSSYNISHIIYPEETHREFGYYQGFRYVDQLTIPISPADAGDEYGPFVKLRDFNHTFFTAYLPLTLKSKVKSVELIVDHWVILEIDDKSLFWNPSIVDWEPFDNPIELTANPAYINLLKSIPEYKEGQLW